MKLKHKLLIKRLIVIASLIVAIIILSLLKQNIYISENIFSRGISRGYIFLLSNITSWFNFSIFELLVFIVIIILLYKLNRWSKLLIKKRKELFLKSFMNVIIVTLSIVCVYTATASFAYYRQPLPIPQYQGETLNKEQTEALIRHYLSEFQKVNDEVLRDQNGNVILPYNEKEIAQLFIDEYERLGTLDGYLTEFTPRIKNIQSSMFMNYFQTSGIAITPTAEANVNKHTPTNYKLITIGHELAHIKGVMNENQANMLSYYLALTSENIYLRYAGYMYTINRLYEIAFFTLDDETYNELYYLHPLEARQERNKEYKFWEKYETKIEKVSEFFNDIYLKLSGIEDGTDNYIDNSKHDLITNPDTGELEYILLEYSPVQKLYIQMYLNRQ